MASDIDVIVTSVMRRIEHVDVNTDTCNLSYGIIVITKAIKSRFGKHFADVLDCIRVDNFFFLRHFYKMRQCSVDITNFYNETA